MSQEQLKNLLLTARPMYRDSTETAIALQHSLMSSASYTYQSMHDRNELIWKIALAGILFGITMVIVVGRIFLRNIVQPLDEAIRAFDRIAQGDLTHDVDISGKGETGQLIRASATMQLHLRVMLDELTLVANRIFADCRNLNASLFDVAEHSEEQHNRVYQAKETVDIAAKEAASVSLSVEKLLETLARLTNCPDNPREREEALAALEGEIADLATTLRLQAFAADEVAMKMHQIAALIVENRQQVQEAYATSAHVKEVTDELKTLVSHFETRREIAESAY
jgi:methyl-accepting chemotaxis protein